MQNAGFPVQQLNDSGMIVKLWNKSGIKVEFIWGNYLLEAEAEPNSGNQEGGSSRFQSEAPPRPHLSRPQGQNKNQLVYKIDKVNMSLKDQNQINFNSFGIHLYLCFKAKIKMCFLG